MRKEIETILKIKKDVALGKRRSKGPIIMPSRSRTLGTDWTVNTTNLLLNASLYARNLHRY
jgi:hypothetical protein